MKGIVAFFVVISLIFGISFTAVWYGHSSQVRVWVKESHFNYREGQPEVWSDLKDKDRDMLSLIVKDALFDLPLAFGGDFDRDERYAYKEELYDVLDVLMNGGNLESELKDVDQSYLKWKNAVDRFLTNRFVAMYHTI